MADRPPLPPHEEIGDETLAPIKWMVPRWPEIKSWLWTGFGAGIALMAALHRS